MSNVSKLAVTLLIAAAVQGLPFENRLDALELSSPQGLTHLVCAGVTCAEIASTAGHNLEDVVNALEGYLGAQEFQAIRRTGLQARQELEREARRVAYWQVRDLKEQAKKAPVEGRLLAARYQVRQHLMFA